MPKENENNPKAVFHMLRAAQIVMDNDIQPKDWDDGKCVYTGSRCTRECIYNIFRSDGTNDCLYEMVSDAISSMTEE